MKRLYLPPVVVLVALAVSLSACGEGDETPPTDEGSPGATVTSGPPGDGLTPTQENTPRAEAIRKVYELARHSDVPMKILEAQELENDGTYAKERVIVSTRPKPESSWVEKHVDLTIAKNIEGVWTLQGFVHTDDFKYTEAEEARQKAQEDARILNILSHVRVEFPADGGWRIFDLSGSETRFEVQKVRMVNPSDEMIRDLFLWVEIQFENGLLINARDVFSITLSNRDDRELDHVFTTTASIPREYASGEDENITGAKITNWWLALGDVSTEKRQVTVQ
ncbi:MAG: hypothetical protein A2Y74_01760 [Actinobacteria bacterium RBG_13_63_9]|nr:MAG: hypothetical protein A2Y74_01760 [Actinobacteria bacterium RBG_13_63_9]